MGERGGGRVGEWESGRVGDEEGIGDGGRPAETRSRRVLAVPADLRYGHVRCVEERDLPGPGGPPAVGRQGECESAALPALSVSVVALRAPLPIAGAQAWRLAGTLAPDPWSETRGAQTFILAPDPEPHRWAWLWNRTRAHMEARRPAVIAEEQPQLPGSALPATPDCERCPTSGDAPAAAASDTPAEGSGAVSPELVHRLWLAHGTSVWLDAHRREPGDLRTRFLLTCAWQERESGILLEATRVTRALAGLSTSEGASEVLLTAMACGPRPHADLAAALPMRPPAAGDARAAGATDALRRLLAEAGTASPTPLSALSPESLSALARRAGE